MGCIVDQFSEVYHGGIQGDIYCEARVQYPAACGECEVKICIDTPSACGGVVHFDVAIVKWYYVYISLL